MATIEDADPSVLQHEKLHIPEQAEEQASKDMETLTVDSGITDNSDHASSVSAPDSPNQPCLSSTSGSMEGELNTASIQPQCNKEEEQLSESGSDLNSSSSLNEYGRTKSSLLECLEPRPPPSREVEEKGGVSPKDVHRHLMRRVENVNSNGHSVSDSSVTVPREPSPSSSIPLSQQKQPWAMKLPFLKRKSLSYASGSDAMCQSMVAATSTTGLILENRPRNLPAKSRAEEKRHQKMYEGMVAAARKKELREAEEALKQKKKQQQKEQLAAEAQRQWSDILPKWEAIRGTRKVRDLWWLGLPPGVRGNVWMKAIGNELNISPELYEICLRRCKDRLAVAATRERSDSSASVKSLSREQSVEVIHLDILRTFPTLGFFQEGGPFHQTLHDVLGAYACYRPDVGYVQGMSFLAAVLLLNMEAADAFICLANLLNRPSYLAFFKVEQELMKPYFNAFQTLLKENLPRLFTHFQNLSFSPEFYLIEWIFTLYTKSLPLDVACRVWDMFCRDGDVFLFRTALGILRMHQSSILELGSIEEIGPSLSRLFMVDSDTLFQHIEAISISDKRFKQLLKQ